MRPFRPHLRPARNEINGKGRGLRILRFAQNDKIDTFPPVGTVIGRPRRTTATGGPLKGIASCRMAAISPPVGVLFFLIPPNSLAFFPNPVIQSFCRTTCFINHKSECFCFTAKTQALFLVLVVCMESCVAAMGARVFRAWSLAAMRFLFPESRMDIIIERSPGK